MLHDESINQAVGGTVRILNISSPLGYKSKRYP